MFYFRTVQLPEVEVVVEMSDLFDVLQKRLSVGWLPHWILNTKVWTIAEQLSSGRCGNEMSTSYSGYARIVG